MGHLVRTLRGDRIAEELQQAYRALARAYLRQRAGGLVDVDDADFIALQIAVLRSESWVDLAEAKSHCELIETDSERPGELFDQLGHMSVLLAAASALASLGLHPNICAPTQQSADAGGQPIPDLGGINWFLEAYGGVDYGNNGKLAKDLRSLDRWVRTSPTGRLFLAFRPPAWYRATPLSPLSFNPIAHRCSKHHGRPFRATAEGQVLYTSTEVQVVEVRNIRVADDPLDQVQ
jgi:hypothetical protein